MNIRMNIIKISCFNKAKVYILIVLTNISIGNTCMQTTDTIFYTYSQGQITDISLQANESTYTKTEMTCAIIIISITTSNRTPSDRKFCTHINIKQVSI